MNQRSVYPNTMDSRSSLQKFCKLQKKISDYIHRQSIFDINLEKDAGKLSA
jgi:hypothetical protein